MHVVNLALSLLRLMQIIIQRTFRIFLTRLSSLTRNWRIKLFASRIYSLRNAAFMYNLIPTGPYEHLIVKLIFYELLMNAVCVLYEEFISTGFTSTLAKRKQ